LWALRNSVEVKVAESQNVEKILKTRSDPSWEKQKNSAGQKVAQAQEGPWLWILGTDSPPQGCRCPPHVLGDSQIVLVRSG
jgi:hypothetical protein